MKWSPFSHPFTHTPSFTPNAHAHSHLHSTLRLSSASDSWSYNHFLTSTSGPVRSSTLYTTLVLDSPTLTISPTNSILGDGRRGWWNSWLFLHSLSHCQSHPANHPHSSFTLSSAMQLSHPYKTFPSPHTLPTCPSVQFKFIAASMSSTGDVRGWKLWILFPIYQHGSGNVNN